MAFNERIRHLRIISINTKAKEKKSKVFSNLLKLFSNQLFLEPKEPEIDFHFRYESPRKSVFGTLKTENKAIDMRKGSLPTVCPEVETKDLISMNTKTPKVVTKREEWGVRVSDL